MRLLLDTHIVYWVLVEPSQLSKNIVEILNDQDNELFFSEVILFELTIKYSLGKLKYKGGLKELFNDIRLTGFKMLRLDESHYLEYEKLPFHHRDPFDRLLIAQAKAEALSIVTKDENFARYGVKIIW